MNSVGEKYFLGPKSYLYHLITSKRPKDSRIEVLVFSPDSSHITDELANSIEHDSAERIHAKMRIVLRGSSVYSMSYSNDQK